MKPIIGAQGEFVTEGIINSYYWTFGIAGDIYKNIWTRGLSVSVHGDQYVTREAAEMALVRAKALRRLKEMAYGGGWVPEPNEYHGIYAYISGENAQGEGYEMQIDVMFKDFELAHFAEKTITPEEREAFLYVHKPMEDE